MGLLVGGGSLEVAVASLSDPRRRSSYGLGGDRRVCFPPPAMRGSGSGSLWFQRLPFCLISPWAFHLTRALPYPSFIGRPSPHGMEQAYSFYLAASFKDDCLRHGDEAVFLAPRGEAFGPWPLPSRLVIVRHYKASVLDPRVDTLPSGACRSWREVEPSVCGRRPSGSGERHCQ